MPYECSVMGEFLRFWLTNALFLTAGIAVVRATHKGLGGELDLEYTLREVLSVATASLVFTLVYNLPPMGGAGDRTLATALFTPGCIAMMLLYKVTHMLRIEAAELGLMALVFLLLHVAMWLTAATLMAT